MNAYINRENIDAQFTISWHEPKNDRLMSSFGTRGVYDTYPTTCDNMHSDCARILDMVDNLERGALLVPICDEYDYPEICVEFYACHVESGKDFNARLILSYEDGEVLQAIMSVRADLGTTHYCNSKSVLCCDGWGLWETLREGMKYVFGIPV